MASVDVGLRKQKLMEYQWSIQKSFYLLEWSNSIPSLLLVCFIFTTPFPNLLIHIQTSARRHRIHSYDSDRPNKDGGTTPNKNEFKCRSAPLESNEIVFGLSLSIIIRLILDIQSSIIRRMENGPLEAAVAWRHNLVTP
jgi:hypothetical protein